MPRESSKLTENKKPEDASASPAYLKPPVRELVGLGLLKYRLDRKLRRYIGRKNLFSFNNNSQFLKRNDRVRLTEAVTMDFIRRNTTIPVPHVLDVFSIDGVVAIVQERIHGHILEDVWHKLSLEEQRSSMAQIKDCLDQLRALKPPHPERVQAIDESGLIDCRLGSGEWGPFNDHDGLHEYLGYDIFREFPERYPLMQEALSTVHGRRYKTVFAHGDLGPHNVIWKDGRIVVIDWERSGWFPEYWDYTRAYVARGFVMLDWWEMFRETVANRYDDEVELDIQIANYIERGP